MTLPLPRLDDRRWRDLVEEGRGLIPRFSPAWTDHNAHDPGVTLMELHAWLVEATIYRLDRVPDRHRRKFLALAGVEPRPPRAAHGTVALAPPPGTSPFTLPAGTVFETRDGGAARFRTLRDLDVAPVELVALQTGTGDELTDRTAEWREGLSLTVPGPDPQPGDALYLGFRELPSGPVALFFHFEGTATGLEERRRIQAEAEAQRAACRPVLPEIRCDGDDGNGDCLPAVLPPHHSAAVAWEVFAGGGDPWARLEDVPYPGRPTAGQAVDDTRSLTLDGLVELHVPPGATAGVLGGVAEALFYLRCRLASGAWDAPPVLRRITANGVLAVDAVPAAQSFVLPAGLIVGGDEPVPGKTARFTMALDDDGNVTALDFLAADDGSAAPAVRVLAWEPATLASPGRFAVELVELGLGDGRPSQRRTLVPAPVVVESAGRACPTEETPRIVTLEAGGWREWTRRADFDASRRIDPHFVLDATSGEVVFGDGERGLAVPEGALILGTWQGTRGASGNLAGGTAFRPSSVETSLANELALSGLAPDVRELLGAIVTLPEAATGGAGAEDLGTAAGRAIELLSTHERLLEVCEENRCRSLDDVPRERVRSLKAPTRGVGLLDLERLALDVPGTRVARARAWAGVHPVHPCLSAPGHVTLVVVPDHDVPRPRPSPGLLAAVQRYLDRRRTVTTQVSVVGPEYLEVSVQARVRACAYADTERLALDITATLDTFLDPLHGGPRGLGWPFGRDVYRTEVLERIDAVPGVDHVLELFLVAGTGEPRCGNLSLCPTWLATPAGHRIEIERGER